MQKEKNPNNLRNQTKILKSRLKEKSKKWKTNRNIERRIKNIGRRKNKNERRIKLENKE